MTQHTCLWWETAPAPRSYFDTPLPDKTEVVVIGGGYTGTSAALELAKGGARVVLLEADTIGWGASSRNGGQALSCLHYTLTKMIGIHGRERATEMFLAAVQAANTVEQIVAEEHIECDFVRCGNIEAASRPSHFEALKREQETLRELVEYEVQVIPRSEMASELGTKAYHGLMVNPRSGSVQPARFVQGMALAAERAGAEIREGTRVLGIDRMGDPVTHDGIRFKVRTERGDVLAREVVVAANAWAGTIVPHFRQRVFPIDSFIIATARLPKDLAGRLIPNNRVVYDTRRVLAYYRLSPDGRMVWGGELTSKVASAGANIRSLRSGMIRVFPELADVSIDYYWSGTLGLTIDENAHAGRVDGLWYSMCYVGHGVTLATYLGQQIARAVLGLASNNPFANLAIPRVPVFRDQAWLMDAGRLWYRVVDLLG
jgi:glycine/D-amino acid oxidase-like deaminating enzyme